MKSSTILNLFPYVFQFLLYNFEAFLSDIFSWWLSPFMIMKYSMSLFISRNTFHPEVYLPNVNTAIWGFFGGGGAWCLNGVSFSVLLLLMCLYTQRVTPIKSLWLNLAFFFFWHLLIWLALRPSSFYFYFSFIPLFFPFLFLKNY